MAQKILELSKLGTPFNATNSSVTGVVPTLIDCDGNKNGADAKRKNDWDQKQVNVNQRREEGMSAMETTEDVSHMGSFFERTWTFTSFVQIGPKCTLLSN